MSNAYSSNLALNLSLASEGAGSTGAEGILEGHFRSVQRALREVPLTQTAAVVKAITRARDAGATVYVFGNGGSAATSLHFANDLAMIRKEGVHAIRVVSLSANVSVMTAIANDLGYEHVFSEQLRPLVRPGDLVIGISGSGNSPNTIEAFECAKAAGAECIGILGFDGGALLPLSDTYVHVPCSDYLVVEDVHMTIGHAIARALR